jgi:hypothetical protein
VAEIWRAFGLKPWREDDYKISPDPELVEKIRDIVAPYMNPPVAAAVFAVDEKPQIQTLNRTAPTLPMLPTTPARATHDYQRNGTCDLFAALDLATGNVITDIRKSRTSADFVTFLNKVNRNVPAKLDVHVILDNLSALSRRAGGALPRRRHRRSPGDGGADLAPSACPRRPDTHRGPWLSHRCASREVGARGRRPDPRRPGPRETGAPHRCTAQLPRLSRRGQTRIDSDSDAGRSG